MSSYDSGQFDRLEPAYLANYGLTQTPFSNLHDDSFLYLDAERARRLNLLQHMTQYSNLLLIVQGEHGVGKTSLLTRFIKNADANWKICEVTANTLMDAGMLMFEVAKGFGLQTLPQDSGELQEMLYTQIAKLHHQDEIPILVIDDAHTLSRDALLAIFHMADTLVEDANLLRIILFAEPQIERVLNAKDVRPFRERITHTMEIPALDEDTTAEYLKYRMAVAGFNGGSPFTPKMIKRIYNASAGIPEKINQLAHETLDKGDFTHEEVEKIVIAAKPPRQYKNKILLGMAIALVALILVFQSLINRFFEDSPKKTTTLPIPLAQQTVPASPGPAVMPATPPSSTPAVISENQAPAQTARPSTAAPDEIPPVQQKIIPLQIPHNETPEQAAVSTSAQNLPQSANAEATTTDTEQVTVQSQAEPAPIPVKLQSVSPDPLPPSNTRQTMMLNGEGFTAQTRVFVSWADRDIEIPAVRVKHISGSQLQVTLTVGTQHHDWKVHVVDAKQGNSNTLAFTVATPAWQKKKIQDQVLAREPSSFTLQLFSSHEQKNAKAFIRQHKLGEQASYFISKRKGQPWYSVIYGVYPDQAAARAATKTLPVSLQKIKPWVRRYDAIQASINATRQLKQQQTKPVVKPTPVLTTSLPKQAGTNQYASWIWSQDPSYFTLQLMGTHDVAAAKRFVQVHQNLNGQAIYFHTHHDGRDWYAVIFGVYPDKQKAREAIKRLPKALQKSSPWIRRFASIHAELSRTQ